MPAMQIPKPLDEQVFERRIKILFRCILKDPAVKRHGRRGQKQYGVDILGLRNGNPARIVGVQCKLKGQGKELTEEEVKDEVEKARLFEPPLSEFIIVTTAPTDGELDRLALTLSDSNDRSAGMRVSVWGWETLQEEINQHRQAIEAFDPSWTPWANELSNKVDEMKERGKKANDILLNIQSFIHTFEPVIDDSAIHDTLEPQINEYASLVRHQPSVALRLLESLLEKHSSTVSKHIRFRIVSNIAGCHLNIGNEEVAAKGFIEAFDLDPENTKAIANKALGLLLNEDWDNLRSFAESHLSEQSNNARLAAFYIHSLIVDEAISDPLGHVPDAVRNSTEVAIANVRWLMERGDDGDWWEAAKAAYKVDPQNDELSELYACALLEQVLTQSVFVYGRELSETDRNHVQTAIKIYASLWSKICENSRPVRNEQVSIPINLVIAYRIHDQAEEAIKTGNEALIRFPQNGDLRMSLAAVLVERREFDHALDLTSDVHDHPETITMRFEIALVTKDWQTISDLVSNELDSFPEDKRTFPVAIGILAQVALAPAENRRSILEVHRNNFQGDACALIALAQCCRLHDFDDLAKSYFTAAILAVDSGDDRLDSRTSVAQEAIARGKYGTAVGMLHGYVPVDRKSPPLLLLAQALIGLYPIRQRAIEFFEKLPPHIRELHDFQRMEGILHFNHGNPNDAIASFSRAFKMNACVANLIDLVRAQKFLGDREALRKLLRPEIDTLPGSSLDRLQLCHFLIDIGENERAIDIAYEALIDGLNSHDVVAKYLKVVLKLSSHFQDRIYDEVAQGLWVRFTSHQDKTFQVIVGESADRLWGERADLSNTFITHALGKKVDDKFEYINAFNTTEIWTISEIKPRWLQAFYHLSGRLGQRYPEVEGIAVFTIAEDDIQPVLDQMRHSSEAMYDRAISYLNGKVPMAFFAKGMVGGSIAFADYIRYIRESIHVSYGSEFEYSEAHSWIDSNDHSGAVIDAFTAWRAAELCIFPILKERLGSLSIPASEMATIRAMVQSQQDVSSRESASLSYHEGKYSHYSITPEEQSVRVDKMKGLLADIEDACRVETAVIPDELPDSVEQILSSPVGDTLVCAILAREGNLLLLCEDMIMRQWARAFLDVRGVWLQAVLSSAVENGTLTHNGYSDALVQLALRRHFHIPMNVPVLLSVFERDKSPNLEQLEILCTAFGSKTADRDSHVEVVVDFINRIWADNRYKGEQLTKPTSTVLNALLLNGNSKRDLWDVPIYTKLNSAPKFYFAQWCKEHPIL